MFNLAVGGGAGGGAALALVTDRAAEPVERMAVMIRVIRQRQRKAGIAGILDRHMTARAPVYAVEFGQDDLANLQRGSRGIDALLRGGRACDLILEILALPVLPLAVLVLIKSDDHRDPDHQAEHGEPGIKFAQRSIH